MRILVNGVAETYTLAAGVSNWQEVQGNLYWTVNANDVITFEAQPSRISSMDNGQWSTLSVQWTGVDN